MESILIGKDVNIKSSPTFKSHSKGIYLYGADNLYPNMYKAHVRNSGTATSCTNTFSNFLSGEGFEDANNDKLIINRNGLTLLNLLRFIAHEKAQINFALHISYNRFAQITDITPVSYELIRKKIRTKNEKFEKYVLKQEWGNSSYSFVNQNIEYEYFAFNPEKVKEQIKEVGFSNFTGQIYYVSNTYGESEIYQYGMADVSLKSMQFEDEAENYSLANIQNGFSLHGALSYPSNLSDIKGNERFEAELKENAKGSTNAGRILTIPKLPSVESNLEFISFAQNDIDSLFEKQLKEAQNKIKMQYNVQDALLGVSNEGFLSKENIREAYEAYNNFTRLGRLEIQNHLEFLFQYSIFNVKNFAIAEKIFK